MPVGRRFAYDEATGRVWVICGGCSRWNLVPFESRWEAIEEAEKAYRGTALRASTDQVGLAKTREGSELVRIGKPLVPELASWRYGRHFAKRRWAYATTTLPLSALLLVALQPGVVMNVSRFGGSFAWELAAVAGAALLGSELKARLLTLRTLATLPLIHGAAALNRAMMPRVMVAAGEDGAIRLWIPVVPERIEDKIWFSSALEAPLRFARAFMNGDLGVQSRLMTPSHYTAVAGDDAHAALRLLLPILNESGATKKSVGESLSYLERFNNDPGQIAFGDKRPWEREEIVSIGGGQRERWLALEMAVHADSERRWLDGEMATLLDEWRRADEIASIADSLLRDPTLEAKLDTLRDGRTVTDGASG